MSRANAARLASDLGVPNLSMDLSVRGQRCPDIEWDRTLLWASGGVKATRGGAPALPTSAVQRAPDGAGDQFRGGAAVTCLTTLFWPHLSGSSLATWNTK